MCSIAEFLLKRRALTFLPLFGIVIVTFRIVAMYLAVYRKRAAHARIYFEPGAMRKTLVVLIKYRGVEQWQLVWLITTRSQVRVLPPLPRKESHQMVGLFSW
jgi:hypothetical protein